MGTRQAWEGIVLVVEDNEQLAKAIGRMFRGLAAKEVHVAHTLEDALGLLDRPFNLVLSDVGLPEGPCVPLLRRVRRDLPECLFVVMTGRAPTSAFVDLAVEGAHGFLQKPFDLAGLLACLERADESRASVPER